MPEYESMYTQRPERYQNFVDFLTRFAVRHEIAVLDFGTNSDLPTSDSLLFFDAHHLSSAGARLFSKVLGRELRDVGGER